jgi:hypothetical protein
VGIDWLCHNSHHLHLVSLNNISYFTLKKYICSRASYDIYSVENILCVGSFLQ